MSKNSGRGRARKSAVLLGFRGFLTLNFQNSFLGVLGAKSGQKAHFGSNFCKSLKGKYGKKVDFKKQKITIGKKKNVLIKRYLIYRQKQNTQFSFAG